MSSRTEHITFKGPAGVIDCVLDWPDEAARGWALVLHPHPLHGGTRDNKVVTTIARACTRHGLLTVRPNFRGVGKSEGEFDRAEGETADMQALVEQLEQLHPDITAGPWVVAGFSFGSAVAAQLQSAVARKPQAVILAGTAVQRFRFMELDMPKDALLVHGEKDDVVPLAEAMDFARQFQLPILVLPDAEHFFHGRLVELRSIVERHLAAALL